MIAIVDYDAGNLRSVQRACAAVGMEAELVADGKILAKAERIIFPGVGTAESAMDTLRERGLDVALQQAFADEKPILGICLGAQVVLEFSEEGDQQCLGLIPGRVAKFCPDDPSMKVPHMGWNAVNVLQPHPLLEGFTSGNHVYYVHSYFPQPTDESAIYAKSEYGHPFAAVIGRRNLVATQFHLEKSGRVGLELLARFACWDGTQGGAPC